MSLRRTLSTLIFLMGGLTLLTAACLMILTTVQHSAAMAMSASVESLQLAEEAEIDLLLHSRTLDPVVRSNLEASVRRRLSALEQYISTEEERLVFLRARDAVHAHLAHHQENAVPLDQSNGVWPIPVDKAHSALDALVNINVSQARDAVKVVERWDHVANMLGVGVVVLLVLGMVLVLMWLHGQAFQPVFEIQRVMSRFGGGERGARAPLTGPAELREMAACFNTMAETLEQQQNQQLAFLASVAHDLRNPLSALRVGACIVSPHRPLPPESRIRQLVAMVDRQVSLLDRMIGDFLDRARVEAGQLELRVAACDPRQVAHHVHDLFQSFSPHHHLEVQLPDHDMVVQADAARLEQVLTNLVSNAIKYSPHGGRVKIGVSRDGTDVILSVLDQGVGISPEDVKRLFHPFERAGHARSAIPGVGLGLFVCRRIMEAHGGTLEVQSQPGEGSVFSMRIPGDSPQRVDPSALRDGPTNGKSRSAHP